MLHYDEIKRQCLTYIGLLLNVRNWNRIMWNDIVLAVSWSYLMCELDDFLARYLKYVNKYWTDHNVSHSVRFIEP